MTTTRTNVVSIQDLQLSRELNVSVAFVEICQSEGLPVAEAKQILAWFLTLSNADQRLVANAVLRGL